MTYSLLFFAVALGFAPMRALANDTLAQAIEAAHEGDFDRALEGFSRALGEGELARAELVSLLVERSYVWFALRDDSALELDLRTLAWLEPTYQLDRRAPPALEHAWQDAVAEAPKRAPSDAGHDEPLAVAAAAAVQAAPGNAPELRLPVAEPSAAPRLEPEARLLTRREPPARDDRASNRKWWWIGAGGAAVVATSVVLALTLGGNDSAQTELDGPKVTF